MIGNRSRGRPPSCPHPGLPRSCHQVAHRPHLPRAARKLPDHRAIVHDQEPVAHLGQLFEVFRDEKHAAADVPPSAQQAPDRRGAAHVKPARG